MSLFHPDQPPMPEYGQQRRGDRRARPIRWWNRYPLLTKIVAGAGSSLLTLVAILIMRAGWGVVESTAAIARAAEQAGPAIAQINGHLVAVDSTLADIRAQMRQNGAAATTQGAIMRAQFREQASEIHKNSQAITALAKRIGP